MIGIPPHIRAEFAQKRTLHNDMSGVLVTQPAPISSILINIDVDKILA
jgi:hypothetical protein